MSPSRPKVSIHVVGADGSGRSTFIRRYMLDKYDPFYEYSGDINPDSCVKAFAGEGVYIEMDPIAPGMYVRSAADPAYRQFVRDNAPDAVLVIINPAMPSTIEKSLRLRREYFRDVVGAGDKVCERVVILKDVGMSWAFRRDGDPIEVFLNLTPEEREVKEREWRDGADKGYELGRRVGAEVTVACSRSGEGVKEPMDDLIVDVLEKRKAAEERRVQEEQQRRNEAAQAAEERRVQEEQRRREEAAWETEERRVQEERRRREEAVRAAAPRWKRLLWKARFWE